MPSVVGDEDAVVPVAAAALRAQAPIEAVQQLRVPGLDGSGAAGTIDDDREWDERRARGGMGPAAHQREQSVGDCQPRGSVDPPPAAAGAAHRTAVDLEPCGLLVADVPLQDRVDLARQRPDGIFVDADPCDHDDVVAGVVCLPRLIRIEHVHAQRKAAGGGL
jgi:hypothetical protein